MNRKPPKNGKEYLCLAIESSCDETAAAVVTDGRNVLSNIISSQIDIHKAYGGVVPEIASRHHLNNISTVVDQALEEAGVSFEDIDFIGVTNRPGLIGALLIGTATAKALAFALDVSLIGVHHIRGHICANYIAHPDLKPPFASLVVSGGHSTLAEVKDYTEYEILGQTRDDAAGEAYDKVARVLGLGYPGGPLLDKLAKEGDPEAIPFKRVYLEKDSYDFSFSGTKTGVLNYLNGKRQKGEEFNPADVAASFQAAVVEVLVEKCVRLCKERGRDKLVLAGGVAANSCLRAELEKACWQNGIELYMPPLILCTDNAAMIGCAAYYEFLAGAEDETMTLDAYPNAEL
ncbi:MAG: tRNA (adenosine(37)-N6)-threonylcarbamoyltransferase complex transferase subunit TsaD [Firmicutes bacterium]|nr:tRNA (adenosine(37)-N6)-threonylcarbamoyltransferase complex transferase subunit TsaD [Bacillota bacterium]